MGVIAFILFDSPISTESMVGHLQKFKSFEWSILHSSAKRRATIHWKLFLEMSALWLHDFVRFVKEMNCGTYLDWGRACGCISDIDDCELRCGVHC
jgi:hypothetical protein